MLLPHFLIPYDLGYLDRYGQRGVHYGSCLTAEVGLKGMETYNIDRAENLSPQKAEAGPSRLSRWALLAALFTAYVPMQLIFALPVVLAAYLLGEFRTVADLQNPTLLAWMALLSALPAALLTLLVAWSWPGMWSYVTSKWYPLAEWIAWREPRNLPLWSVPLLTVLMLVVVGYGITLLIGPAEIDLQVQLFSTRGLQIISVLAVSTVVPLAEEIVFRGALYNALLPPPKAGIPAWRRHLLPLVVCSVMFAFVHLFAGFGTAASLVMILLLSFYLTALRAVSGSILPSIAGHMAWNLLAALAIMLVNV